VGLDGGITKVALHPYRKRLGSKIAVVSYMDSNDILSRLFTVITMPVTPSYSERKTRSKDKVKAGTCHFTASLLALPPSTQLLRSFPLLCALRSRTT
jgi:hypothetical protein